MTSVGPYQNILEHFLHENAVMMIGLTRQPDYSTCHFIVRLFILTVKKNYDLIFTFTFVITPDPDFKSIHFINYILQMSLSSFQY